MGVNVQRYKGRVFLVSSMYAGLSGVMYALSIGSIAPESFGLEVSIQYLAMIVLGGLGSVGGAALGALFVSALPLVFQRYADVAARSSAAPARAAWPPARRRASSTASAIILVILFEPAGLAGLGRTVPPPGPGPRRGQRHRSATVRDQQLRPPTSRPTDQHKGAPHEARQAFAPARSSLAAVVVAAATGCSNKAQDSSASGGGGEAARRHRPTSASRARPSSSVSSPT